MARWRDICTPQGTAAPNGKLNTPASITVTRSSGQATRPGNLAFAHNLYLLSSWHFLAIVLIQAIHGMILREGHKGLRLAFEGERVTLRDSGRRLCD